MLDAMLDGGDMAPDAALNALLSCPDLLRHAALDACEASNRNSEANSESVLRLKKALLLPH